MEANQFPQLSLQEVLESYSHIELTADEEAEALIAAKRKKEDLLKRQAVSERAALNRRLFVDTTWDFEQTKGFMLYRAGQLFKGHFQLDEANQLFFDLLCSYFTGDENFIQRAADAGIDNPSLTKGIMLVGGFGIGKTWMLQLFAKNKRQCFRVINAKVLANEFEGNGDEATDKYSIPFPNPMDDASNFLQTHSGLCIDDLGTEDIKNHFGNKKNVLGDLIERRYFNKHMGLMFHATSNLTAVQLKEFYGGRVVSRLRECVNWIVWDGDDRRK